MPLVAVAAAATRPRSYCFSSSFLSFGARFFPLLSTLSSLPYCCCSCKTVRHCPAALFVPVPFPCRARNNGRQSSPLTYPVHFMHQLASCETMRPGRQTVKRFSRDICILHLLADLAGVWRCHYLHTGWVSRWKKGEIAGFS